VRPDRARRPIALAGALALSAAAGCTPPAPIVLSGPTMGTSYTVTLLPPAGAATPRALDAEIAALLATLDHALSHWDPAAELSRVNASASTGWLAVSADLAAVLTAARAASEWSGGAFDVTAAPLVDLWGFGPTGARNGLPAAAAVRAARERVGFRLLDVRRQPPAVRKHRPDLRIDLSAIAPGYAVDRIAALLEAHGVRRYLVELGGELRAAGTNALGTPWRVGVERPDAGAAPTIDAVVWLAAGAIATSGDYRRFVERDGRRYAHVIDPRTGAPVTHGAASVSVIAPSAMEADAAATALLVLGPEVGLRLALDRGVAALYLVRERDGLVERMTPAFEARRAAAPGRS
jgi:thiamine biosynthesis lipoprotein